MIAPVRQADPETPEARRRLHQTRHAIARTLLAKDSQSTDNAPPIAAWGAWLFAGWVVIVTAVYFAGMLRLL